MKTLDILDRYSSDDLICLWTVYLMGNNLGTKIRYPAHIFNMLISRRWLKTSKEDGNTLTKLGAKELEIFINLIDEKYGKNLGKDSLCPDEEEWD